MMLELFEIRKVMFTLDAWHTFGQRNIPYYYLRYDGSWYVWLFMEKTWVSSEYRGSSWGGQWSNSIVIDPLTFLLEVGVEPFVPPFNRKDRATWRDR